MSARVLITRLKRALSGNGFTTGEPSIGTRIAGELLMMTRGGELSTCTGAALIPAAASDASSRSSDIVRTDLVNSACSSDW